jgi:integrative and conjugative element protein (TIGR02256 family)
MTTKHYTDHLDRYTVSLSESMIKVMLKWCKKANGMETGGIILGRYSVDLKCAEISRVIGPASDSLSGKTWFIRGIRRMNGLLRRLWILRKDYYLGEWHYHPNASPIPSSIDIAQLMVIAKSESYNCPEPILIIIGGDPHSEWSISINVFSRAGESVTLIGATRR